MAMETQQDAPWQRTGPRIGRDELNLAEFPFALLATRPAKGADQRLCFQDGQKEWTVEGSGSYGLPNAVDVQVYVVLMEITREQGFPMSVFFNRSHLVKRLGWIHSGASYDRLVLALDRLVSVTIRTKNAFYDASQRKWMTKEAFHILESYKIADVTQANAEQPSLFPSWIRWSQEIYANMQAGYIKSLDVDLFLSLQSSISQALYRYLDAKRYDGKPCYRIGLKKLAWEHLGMSRGYYASDIKRKLKPAHEELVKCGFLSGAEYAPMKSGEEMVVYHFQPRPARGEAQKALPAAARPDQAGSVRQQSRPAPAAETPSGLPQRLMTAGLSRHAAQTLAAAQPEECERQLLYLPFREARDPGAVLAKSIREGWAAPPAWTEAQDRARKAEKARRAGEKAAEKARSKAEDEAEWDAWWSARPGEERREIEAAALAELRRENRVLAAFADRHPDSPVLQGALRPLLKKHSGWTGPGS
jgi:plasmid replication initiation protein